MSMVNVREAVILDIPPTSNHLYSSMRGRLVLSAAGRGFSNRLTAELGQQWQSLPPLDPNAAYGVYSCAHLHALENAGYKTGKTDTRWRRRDASNLYKIVADTVSKLIGVDDSASFDTSACKRRAPVGGEQYMHIVVYIIEESDLDGPPPWLP